MAQFSCRKVVLRRLNPSKGTVITTPHPFASAAPVTPQSLPTSGRTDTKTVNLDDHLEQLRTDLQTTTGEGRETLEPLLAALAVSILVNRNLRDAASLERLEADLAAVADAAGETVRRAYVQAGQMQAQLLGADFDELLEEAAVLVADEHRAIVLERTAVVLDEHVRLVDGQRDLSYVPDYAQIITDAAVSVGSKEGTEGTALILGAAALAAGALYKTFVRVSSRKEPRAHSKLEGQTILADELWDIGGYLVFGPNDEALPLSERLFCGHANAFFVD